MEKNPLTKKTHLIKQINAFKLVQYSVFLFSGERDNFNKKKYILVGIGLKIRNGHNNLLYKYYRSILFIGTREDRQN